MNKGDSDASLAFYFYLSSWLFSIYIKIITVLSIADHSASSVKAF